MYPLPLYSIDTVFLDFSYMMFLKHSAVILRSGSDVRSSEYFGFESLSMNAVESKRAKRDISNIKE